MMGLQDKINYLVEYYNHDRETLEELDETLIETIFDIAYLGSD